MIRSDRATIAAQSADRIYAVPIEFPVHWDTGAPLPYLLQNDYRTFLAFFLHTVDPNWDGTYVNVRNPSSELKRETCTCRVRAMPLRKNGHSE
jgi:hypothetical protein